MSVPRIPRRLAQPAASQKFTTNVTTYSIPFRPRPQSPAIAAPQHQQSRHVSWFGLGKERTTQTSSSTDASRGQTTNPLLADYLKKKPSLQANMQMPQRGDLGTSSIFEQDERKQRAQQEADAAKKARNLQAMAGQLDPAPRARRHWEARMVAREVRRRGRMSRAAVLRQTERVHASKSPMIKTSVKKLGMLARQIAGKTLEEAMVQMRFSKKAAAKNVLDHLEYARDSAVVRNGMGLGKGEEETRETVLIRDKDGNRVKVTDPTSMYIDEAWVGRGEYGKKPEYRARGRVNILRLPETSLTVVLKEEATRVRQHKEREEKKAKKKPWMAMPDRPITAQHQYPLW